MTGGQWILTFRISFAASLALVTYLALSSSDMVLAVPGWDKAKHVMAFVVLALLLDYSLPDRAPAWHTVNLAKWLFLVAYGVGIETVQWYLELRSTEWLDVLADLIGVMLYCLFRQQLSSLPPLQRINDEMSPTP